MKILAIHNFHRKGSASGDDQVFKSETALLESHGNQVIKYTVSNDEFDNAGLIGKLSATFGMLWNSKNYRAVRQMIEKEKPDIVHIHTFFPLLSPSILYAAKRSGVKVVATLHDTRFVCPCSTSLRGTELCNECGDGKYFRMCKYGCFKNSRLQSFIVAGIFTYHRIRKSFYKQIDRYICLNENQIRLLTNIGFDKNKISKKYNFVPDAEANLKAVKVEGLPERYVVFYGRIGEEKGIRILMKIWDKLPDIPLVVMGGGPLEEEFRHWADGHDNVVSKEQDILKCYKDTYCCDEVFLQTLVYNSSYKNNLYSYIIDDYHANMRDIDWKRGRPYTWRNTDFDELMASDYLFARKFDEQIDDQIVHKIYMRLKSK